VLIFLGFLLLLGAIVYGVSFLSYLPRFSIQTIEVTGAKEVPAPLITGYVESLLFDGSHPLLSRSNVFLYPRVAIGKAIVDYFPRIRTAAISRESFLAQTIRVAVEEREAYARWCLPTFAEGVPPEECFLLDDGGFIFADTATSTGVVRTGYVFTGALAASTSPIGQRFLPGRIAGILALLERLGQAGHDAKSVAVESERDFEVRLLPAAGSGRGFIVRASFGNDGEAVVRNLELVLSSDVLRGREAELEYVDLRFGNRVYYKLKGDATVTTVTE
jgi:hypothetical protein